jgi:AcrR family transcriptional regulator
LCAAQSTEAAIARGDFLRQANAQLHSDRRTEILDAARRCFARTGFHQTSMQQICAEAGMSPGNVYRYFPSKEAIIAGIAERDRAEVAAQLAGTQFATDFFSSFAALARHHFVERTAEEVGLGAEIMSESRRNPTISKIMNEFDADVKERLVTMLQSAQSRGDIARDADIGAAVEMLMIIADGVWWRRAVDPNFDAEAVLPMFFDVTKYMLLERGKGQKSESAGPDWARAARAGAK